MGDEDGAEEDALESARRVYDRQVDMLENIDDVSMRTFRTDILVFGFVAAAVTAGGPDAASSLHWFPVAMALGGCVSLLVSAFVCIGVYNLTEYPNEVGAADLRVADELSDDEWVASSVERMEKIVPATGAEVQQNGEYLAMAQGLTMFGTFALAYAAGLAIANQSYGLDMTAAVLSSAGVPIIGLVVVGLAKFFRARG